MAYVEHIDNDARGSNNGVWIILGVVIVVLFLMLMLSWGGVFGTQVQQVMPFYSGQTNPVPGQMMNGAQGTQGAPGAPGAGGTGGAAGAPGAPGAAGAPAAPAQTTSPTTP